MIDRKLYNQYMEKGDYMGLSNYLSTFHFKNAAQQNALNNTIKTLRSQGRMIQGMLNRADGDQRQALAFINAYTGGTGKFPGISGGTDANGNEIPGNNHYSVEYNEAINRIGSTADKQAYGVSIKFGGKKEKRYGVFGIDWLSKDKEYENDAYTEMLRATGLTTKGLQKAGAKVSVVNGQYVVNIDKNNPMFDKIYSGLKDIKNDRGLYRFQLAGTDGNGKLIKGEELAATWANRRAFSDVQESDGYYFNPTGNNIFEHPSNIIAAAKKQSEAVTMPKQKSDEELTTSTTAATFSCARQSQLDELLRTGRIKPEMYNVLTKQTNDAINAALSSADLSQYEVWANNLDEGTGTRHKIEDSKTKYGLTNILRSAVGTDRLEIVSAMQGNQTGSLITIKPQMSKDKEKGNTEDDIKQNSLQIFIPGFMNDDAEKAFNRRTETRALKELANMEAYEYNFDTVDGSKINVWNDKNTGTAVYQLENQDGSARMLSKDEALAEINKSLIAEDGINLANQSFYNEDGNIRDDIKTADGSINPDFMKNIQAQVSNYATAAMSELYPDAWKSFQPLSKYIYAGDTTSDDYKKVNNTINASFIDKDNVDFINNKRLLLAQFILNNMGINDNFNII